MDINTLDVYSLLPSQAEQLLAKLKEAISAFKYRKDTVSRVVTCEKEKKECPHCSSIRIIKYGHNSSGIQNYKCKDCQKKFNALTGTVFAGTHLSYQQIEIFLRCHNDKISLRKTAARMGVDKKTVHLLRLKFNDSCSQIRNSIQLKGEVEADEMYCCINLKGTKKKNMPRASKPRKSDGTSTQGISRHKVCIVSAIDENDNCFLEIAGNGPVTSDMIRTSLVPKINKISSLITDCKSSYESVASENSLILKQIKSVGHTDVEGNSLANINSLHSGWGDFISKFHGVSTKHLQGYLDWYMYDKYLNYTIEVNCQANHSLKQAINHSTSIKVGNAYENHSPLDFGNIYADYAI